MESIVLIGGGGHCKAAIDVIEKQNKFKISGIIDLPEFLGSKVFEYPVIGNDNDLEIISKKIKNAIITIGQIETADKRIKLFNKAIEVGFNFPTIISPRAHIGKFSKIGEGTIVMHDVIINTDSEIGKNCIINTKALIEHDCKILDHCHISTNATINGNVVVESGSFVGSGCVSNNSIKIKKNSFIKAGSLIK